MATTHLAPGQNDHTKNKSSMTTSITLSTSIQRPASEVYDYMRDPAHLTTWAAGLALSVKEKIGQDTYLIETPNGEATVRFTEENKFRIMDHWVKQGPDPEVYIPIRILENGKGSEVIFTLFRLPGMTDERFAQDKQAVQKDLATLKKLLEPAGK